MKKLESGNEIRHFRRFREYDYSRGAALFITIVTNPRRRFFGRIVDARLQKTQLGLAVERRLIEMGQMPGIRLFNSVVMPDHVHLQLHLRAGLSKPLVALGRAIGAFKSLCAKDFHELTGESGSLWQQGYHDWICQSAEMIAAVNRYIDYNPLKFELRYNQPEFLAIHEPLAAWRLSAEEFWRGIGVVGMLDGSMPLIALRISRKLSPRQVGEAVSRIRRRAGDYVFVGGWISPGEKAVRDMLLAEPKGRIIQILPSAMPHDYKVGSLWLGAIRDRRAAIIARGNSEIEFSRVACLEVNEAAARIATASGGIGMAQTQELAAQELRLATQARGLAAQVLPSGQGQGREFATQALPSGLGKVLPCGKAVYWLPEGPKVVS
jgi:REP element-mobilizing transposase RayT